MRSGAQVNHAHEDRALRILKPHGSINWEETDGHITSWKPSKGFPSDPIVVAPTHLKFIGTGNGTQENGSALQPTTGYLNQSKQIADVWAAMEREMRAAKALVFIGYSFPSSDLYFSSVLRSALTVRETQPFVIVVNPDAMAIRGRLNSRFALPLEHIQTFEKLHTLNQVTRAQMLNLF